MQRISLTQGIIMILWAGNGEKRIVAEAGFEKRTKAL
jgi:hypothetical protein